MMLAMSSDTAALGERMKGYEAATRTVLPRRRYAIVRADMRAAHAYLRLAERPFDEAFMAVMDATAAALCKEMSGAALAYTQSDEISVLLTDFGSVHAEPWFGGVVQKAVSLAAATATAEFNHLAWRADSDGRLRVPHFRATFDARVFTIPDPVEVANYFVWRQQDCVRNSVSMAAQAYFSHKRLHGLNGGQMQELLWQEKQVNWNDYPEGARRGRLCHRVAAEEEVTYTDKRSGEENTVKAARSRWVSSPAPRFEAVPGSFLAAAIPPMPGFHEAEAEAVPASSRPVGS
jgi:tRNA(His) 5'-end guanylyltransferase